MFKSKPHRRAAHDSTERGDATRDRILDAALALFRKRGLDRTTMRDIAKRAGMSLGSAYYYFPTKEALVHGFYDRVQVAHRRLARKEDAPGDLAARIRHALLSKLDAVRDERALLGALFRYVGEPGHPLSVLSAETRAAREDAVATFAAALVGAGLPPEMQALAARGLWALHLLVLLYFIHDDSPRQARTTRLAEQAAGLFASVCPLLAAPGAAGVLAPVVGMLRGAGLIEKEMP